MKGQVFVPSAKPEFNGALHSAPHEVLDLAMLLHGIGRESGVMLERLPAATPAQPAIAGHAGITTEGTHVPSAWLYPKVELEGAAVMASKRKNPLDAPTALQAKSWDKDSQEVTQVPLHLLPHWGPPVPGGGGGGPGWGPPSPVQGLSLPPEGGPLNPEGPSNPPYNDRNQDMDPTSMR
ncbi:hypothetical protein E4T56_gene16005 [Termitomyces sp. T112]|nr:hypothetical protein E4T56_gene16005 [Termitomyces sp. T112]